MLSQSTYITPVIAEAWLASVPENQRRVIRVLVDRYADDMTEGRWVENGDTIRFNELGELVDGQHRLHAIKKSGCPQNFVVVRGLDAGAIYTIDTGKPRTAACLLSMKGYDNGRIYAALGRLLIAARSGNVFVGRNVPTQQELFRALETDSEAIVDAVEYAVKQTGKRSKIISRVNAALIHYVGSKVDREKTEAYIKAIVSGAGLAPGSAEYLVRERLIQKAVGNTKAGKTSMTSHQQRYILFYGLRCALTGDKPGKFLKVPRRSKQGRGTLKNMGSWVFRAISSTGALAPVG